jgi:hypothetical protein
MPYYACDGPDGEKGKWFRHKGMARDFDQSMFLVAAG